MTRAEESIAAEMGRIVLALFRAGLRVRVWPDELDGRAKVRIDAGPGFLGRASRRPRSATGYGQSPLAAIAAAVTRMNERAGAIVVSID
jgi:hypothetical protein